MGAMKTPGVYIVEKNAFPNSVVEVATAVPAFIGYTEKASDDGVSLTGKPWRITSMAEFHNFFGFAPEPKFETLALEALPAAGEEPTPNQGLVFYHDGKNYQVNLKSGKHILYYSMLLFFQNGGGPCYIVSVGDYKDADGNDQLDKNALAGALDGLRKEQEPTMVVIPDGVLLAEGDYYSLQIDSIMHSGSVMKNRISIVDVYDGFKEPRYCVENFRNLIGKNFLNFATTYYPWVKTTVVQDSDLSLAMFADSAALQELLVAAVGADAETDPDVKAAKEETVKEIQKISVTDASAEDYLSPESLNKMLKIISPLYDKFQQKAKEILNLLPPAAAMAGIYTMVDNSRGVWKAPANVSLNAVLAPSVNITHDEQEGLNVTPQGKSINAIRAFIGEGTLVWGARTLDGNSLDWRYVNVRRTMIMLEESIRLASKAYVFENNDANTWVTIKSMISNFLTGIWKRGGLAGAAPGDAFSVHVGLGETMTAVDILEGILRVTVLVALIRPAEFIEITFQQQMQKS